MMLQPTRADIKLMLAKHQSRELGENQEYFPANRVTYPRSAAIVMPLVEIDSAWHLLYTLRTNELLEHSGQVSFPGGGREPRDATLTATALREMEEEIGVHPDDVVVFGALGNLSVVTGYSVRMIVGEIPWPYPLNINRQEVAQVFTIPLRWLSDLNRHTVRDHTYRGEILPVVYFDLYQGYQLWGASAEMTLRLLKALEMVPAV